LIGTTTLCILFSGITVATENPHEQITIEGVRPAVFDHDTHLGYGVKCGACHHKSKDEPILISREWFLKIKMSKEHVNL
jgi:hypothetical protein